MSIAKSVQFPALLQFPYSPTVIFIVNENIMCFLQDKLIYVAQVISLPFFSQEKQRTESITLPVSIGLTCMGSQHHILMMDEP